MFNVNCNFFFFFRIYFSSFKLQHTFRKRNGGEKNAAEIQSRFLLPKKKMIIKTKQSNWKEYYYYYFEK